MVALSVVVVVLLVPSLVVPASGSASSGPPSLDSLVSHSTAAAGFPTPIQHVIVLMFENQAQSSVLGNSYFAGLCKTYSCATDFYSECHPSEPNYLAFFSDSVHGRCGTDDLTSFGGTSLANSLDASGRSWASYELDMPSACYLKNDKPYDAWHDPAVFFTYVTSSTSYCDSHVLANGAVYSPPSWNTSAPPNFAWVGQGQGGAGTGGNVYSLKDNAVMASYDLGEWESQPWWSSTAMLIAFDEGGASDTSCPGVDGLTSGCGGLTYLAAVSPYSAGVGNDATPSDHFSEYQTVAWLLGLTTDVGIVGTPLTAMFHLSLTGSYTVSGIVSSALGEPLSGATVFANGSSVERSTTTDAAGAFSFQLPNGSVELTATETGYLANATGVTVSGGAITGVSLELHALGTASYGVSGTVQQFGTGAPISGARVYANTSTSSVYQTTSASGTYTFSLVNGSYEFAATAPGDGPQGQSVTVAGTALSNVNFTLSSDYEVSGSVLAALDGAPVPDARVYANSTGGSAQGVGSSNGNYSLALSNGTYHLTAAAAGFEPGHENVTVNGASVSRENFALTAAPAPRYPAEGFVQSSSTGAAISNATLVFTNGTLSVHAATNATGEYSTLLASGKYNITVTAQGYTTDVTQGTVAPADHNILNFTLLPGSSPSSPAGTPWTPLDDYLVIGTVIAVAGLASWVVLRRSASRPPPSHRASRPGVK
ncbi:MAG: carboxypeptidase regulatory-like domain-containing protein [Thermoplasmata archaeon]